MWPLRFIGSFVLCLAIAACGGEGGGSSPAAPAPTVQSVTITVDIDLFHVGTTHTFTATARLSDGSTLTVTGGVWGADTPIVATVEPSTGRVSFVGSGWVTVYVDYRGMRGTKLVRGLPNYQGVWSGSYFIESCSQTGEFVRAAFCSNLPPNRVLPTNLNLTQDRDRVQGRVFLGTLGGDVVGSIQTDGQVVLTGAVQEGGFTIETVWTLQSATAGRITGRLSQLWRAAGFSGDARVTAQIRDLNRTSSVTRVLPGSGIPVGPGLEGILRALAGGR